MRIFAADKKLKTSRCKGNREIVMARYKIEDGVGIIPQGTTRIADSAFSDQAWFDSKELKKVIIPDTVTSIGESAFFGCENLTSILIPNSVKTIGEYAFYGCKKLVSVIIPNSVTEIGQAAFECCRSLKTITLPASITQIGISMFYYCYALEAIYVPKNKIVFFKELLPDYKDFIQAQRDNMMNINDFEKCVNELNNSSMFYMSLGSKELFHSNFLQWLSVTDWKFFIRIMHTLSGQSVAFWWENFDTSIIEVRREYRNFDLSIWIHDNPNETEEKEERWIPVLILENKMKSLPYREQLEEYVHKAFDYWRKGRTNVNIKKEIDEAKRNEVLNTNHGITLIVLSLLKPSNTSDLELPINEIIQYGRKNPQKISIEFSWVCKTYNDLFNAIKNGVYNPKGDPIFFNKILNDYLTFIDNLYKIANEDWQIDGTDFYKERLCPRDLPDDNDEKKKIIQLDGLRIADIREKICYDQLLNLLIKKMKDKGFTNVQRLKSEDISPKKGIRDEFRCRTNYFHNVGLFEAIYLIKERDAKIDNDEPFFITIQIQGNNYTHGISGKNIVRKVDKVNKIGDFFNNKNLDENVWKSNLKFFFDFDQRRDKIAGLKIKEQGAFYKYSTNYIYQCAEIPDTLTINDLIDKILKDVISIEKQKNKLKWPFK